MYRYVFFSTLKTKHMRMYPLFIFHQFNSWMSVLYLTPYKGHCFLLENFSYTLTEVTLSSFVLLVLDANFLPIHLYKLSQTILRNLLCSCTDSTASSFCAVIFHSSAERLDR
ncbi:hypothetical protein ABZP36_017645 [Zizania latifolia]